jgi:glycosyltransferase involved in cell wall biosynthesis
VTVSGKILQNQYGGTIIWHGRDLRLFNPKNYIKKDFRPLYVSEKYREYFVAGFIGTPRPHKGLEDLFDAIKLLRYEHFLLMIVGAHDDDYFMHLRDKIDTLGLRDIVCYLPVQPFEKLPEVLSALDLVIVPQRKRPASYGQVPAKIFDAMAMAKPIVATSVHDIPEILDDCGWLVEPGDPRTLAQTIQYIIDHPNAASEMGRKAREKCKREYSWDIAQERLNKIFAEYVPK